MKNLLLLTGGASSEHEVSVKSRNYIRNLIDPTCYNIIDVLITKDKTWILEANSAVCHLLNKNNQPVLLDDMGNMQNIHLIFPIVLGDTEDGSLPGLFQSLNVPYVGTRVLGSAICFDKISAKRITASYSINHVPFVEYDIKLTYDDAVKLLNCQKFFIKPSNSGSTLGATEANNKQEFKQAILLAQKYDHRILIEKFLSNMQEVFCSVCEIDGKLVPSVIGEAVTGGRVFDYNLKYQHNLIRIADISNTIADKLKQYALQIFHILDCKTFARIDFFVQNEEIYFSEVNTIPAMTETSIFLKLMESTGYKAEYIINQLLESAL